MKSNLSFPVESQHALKEWAIVCAAIRQGRQQLLFRTGGIDETTDGFRLKQSSFWLYPTKFHQTTELLSADFAEDSVFQDIDTQEDDEGLVSIDIFCHVVGIYFVDTFAQLKGLRPFHVLSDDVLKTRFDYRSPGLYVIVVSPAVLANPHVIRQHPRYDGCKSWVRLEDSMATSELEPVTNRVNAEQLVLRVSDVLNKR